MNRRAILAAPIAALLGKRGGPPVGTYSPRLTMTDVMYERFLAYRRRYYPKTDPTKWAPILKGLQFTQDPGRKIEGGAV